MLYSYKMVQIAPTVLIRPGSRTGTEAAEYLETLVNQWAVHGWEFDRIDTISTATPQGCFGGGSPIVINHYVVTFRRPMVPASQG